MSWYRAARGDERSATTKREVAVHDADTGGPASSLGTRPRARTTSAWKRLRVGDRHQAFGGGDDGGGEVVEAGHGRAEPLAAEAAGRGAEHAPGGRRAVQLGLERFAPRRHHAVVDLPERAQHDHPLLRHRPAHARKLRTVQRREHRDDLGRWPGGDEQARHPAASASAGPGEGGDDRGDQVVDASNPPSQYDAARPMPTMSAFEQAFCRSGAPGGPSPAGWRCPGRCRVCGHAGSCWRWAPAAQPWPPNSLPPTQTCR